MIRLGSFTVFILLCTVLVTPVCLSEEGTGATQVVENLHRSLIEAMQTPEKFSARYKLLSPVITNSFDTPAIARIILSRHWKTLDETQQKEFIDLFNDLSVSTYASRFSEYSNQKFKTLEQQDLNKGRVVVKTEMLQANDEPVRFDYILHENEGNWYIISVIANGVNDLSLKRAEYGTMMEKQGYEGLVSELNSKIHTLKTIE